MPGMCPIFLSKDDVQLAIFFVSPFLFFPFFSFPIPIPRFFDITCLSGIPSQVFIGFWSQVDHSKIMMVE